MKSFFLKVAIVVLVLLSTQAFGAEMDKMFYWNNAKGLVAAENCKLATTKTPSLSFVKTANFPNFVNLDNNQGESDLMLASGSLVRQGVINPENKKRGVGVIGVNSVFAPSEMEASRGDLGFVDLGELESISKRFIKINVDYMNVLGGTYWKVFGKDKFLKLSCPEFSETDDYLVFNVYPEDGGRMLARVAVTSSETELFKNINAYSETQIKSKFIEAEADESNSLAEINSIPEIISLDVEKTIPHLNLDVPDSIETEESSDKVFLQAGVDTIICINQNYINVRNEDFSKVIFTAKNGHKVKIFQGWGKNKVVGTVNGKKYDFIKIESLDNEVESKKVGYVVASFVKPKSTCIYDSSYKGGLQPENTTFKGLDDKLCCNFPTLKKVTTPFNEGMRRFGGSRGGGTRAHAAADLYRYRNEPLYAVAPGVVVRSLYYFYEDTFALEVLHSGGFVVRYGELTGKAVSNVSYGKQVKMGDRLGYIGKVNSGCCNPMLHFELFSGKLRGPLTQQGVAVNGVLYSRRRDLLNPTKYLLKWQKTKF